VPIRFPGHVQTPAECHDFLLRLQERLRRYGAAQCRKIRLAQGIAAAQQWHRQWFRPRNMALCTALNALRRRLFPPGTYGSRNGEPVEPPWAPAKRKVRNLKDSDQALLAADIAAIVVEDAQPSGLDPTEDFTTYTEQDPNDRFSITPTTITITDLSREEDAWVYDDKGAGHFGASFEHWVDVKVTDVSGFGVACLWAVSNVIDELYSWWNENAEAVAVFAYTGPEIYLRDYEDHSEDSADIALNTQYYLTISRSSATVTCEIYTNAARTVDYLHDTITTGVPSARAYRYIFAVDGHNDGHPSYTISAVVSNLDLREGGGAATVAPQFMHLARMRRI